jgi:hypothetical protein
MIPEVGIHAQNNLIQAKISKLEHTSSFSFVKIKYLWISSHYLAFTNYEITS